MTTLAKDTSRTLLGRAATKLDRALGREATVTLGVEPGISAQQGVVLREALTELGAQAAVHDVEPDPELVGALEELADSAAGELTADAYGSEETEALDALQEGRCEWATRSLAAADQRRADALRDLEVAERALEQAVPPRSPWVSLLVEGVVAVVLGVLTGLALGATADAAGLKVGGANVPWKAAVPWVAGVVYGVGGGLSLVAWGGHQQRRGWVALGSALFTAPMLGLAVLRVVKAWYSTADDLEAWGDELFKGGVLAAIELGGAIGLAKVADARRHVLATWRAAVEVWTPLVQRKAGCAARVSRVEGEVQAARAELADHQEVVRQRTTAHRAGEKLARSVRAWTRLGYEVELKRTAAALVGAAEVVPRLVVDNDAVRKGRR